MRWFLRFPAWLNDFLHSEQVCSFSPLWVVMCLLRVPASLNDFSHSVHLCGSSPLWWRLRCSALLKDSVHSAHLCSFSPLWIKRCSLRVPAMLNYLVHLVHVCDFSPLWVNRCRFRFLASLNDFCIQHSCVASPHCESRGLVFNVSCPDVMAHFLFTQKTFVTQSAWRLNLSVNSIAVLGECCLRHNLFSTHVANKITTHFSEVSTILILLRRLSVMNWLFCNVVYLVPEERKVPHKMGPKIVLMLLIFWVCLHLSGFSPEWMFTWSSNALQCLFGYCWIFSLFAFWWFYPTMSKQVIS